MTKHDHILYWKETAESNWLAAHDLFGTGKYLECLFLAHLTIEKLSKALWVYNNAANIPPRTHNIIKLWQEANLSATTDQIALAARLNLYQLEGRYEDYQRTLYRTTTSQSTRDLLDEVTILRSWLLSKLP